MNYRNLFEGIDSLVKLENNQYALPINFDNGATTPPLKSVVDTVNKNIQNYGPIARGLGQKGDYCTEEFEAARDYLLEFFNLKNSNTHTVIYTKSTTEGLNLLSKVLIKNKDDIVLTTRMEHHANDLPWRYAASVEYVETDTLGRVRIEDIERKLIKHCGHVKYVAITAASNVTGYINPINKIAQICHKYGAQIIVDGAQIVAHREVNMLGHNEEDQIDFLVFSAHKAYAPFGSGAIIGLKDDLNSNNPFLKGGGCVKGVFDSYVTWEEVPHRLEAGTQNFFGVIAMAKALKDLKEIGFKNISDHENNIKNHILGEINKIKNVICYGDIQNTDDRLGVISFNIKNKNYEEVASYFANKYAIALRCGKFCAHPYVDRLIGVTSSISYIDILDDDWKIGMIRASLGLYNTIEEADKFLNILEYIANTDDQII